jgi:hypothetical protein
MAIRTKPVRMEAALKVACGNPRGFYPVPSRPEVPPSRFTVASVEHTVARRTNRPPGTGRALAAGSLACVDTRTFLRTAPFARHFRWVKANKNYEYQYSKQTSNDVTETGKAFGRTLRPWPTQEGSQTDLRNAQKSSSLDVRQAEGPRVRLLTC